MDSFFLSKIVGIYFVLISIAYLFNPHRCKKVWHDIARSYGLTAICGSIQIIVGMILFFTQNIWGNLLETVLAILGLLIFILGFIYIFFPKFIYHASKRMKKNNCCIWHNIILLIIGGFLVYMGFFY